MVFFLYHHDHRLYHGVTVNDNTLGDVVILALEGIGQHLKLVD